jgi:cell division protein ZapA
MPEVIVSIGGRDFEVACQDGEEHYLKTAARLLDDEAKILADQVGRLPEARMLLMAGLMLADKMASIEDKVSEAQMKLAERDAEVASLKEKAAEPEKVEVPVVPQNVMEAFAEIAARSESLAASIEEKTKAKARPTADTP